jgi:hypothetical protein
MIMGSGPRLRTCVELLDHGVDATGHAPATTDQHEHCRHRERGGFLSPQLHQSAPFDPWQPASAHLDLDADAFAGAFAEAREA